MMKNGCIKTRMLYFLLALACVGSPSVWGGSYTFVPIIPDLGDSPRGSYYYAWSIEWKGPKDAIIEDAVLKFENVNDWTMEFNDVLHIWMIDELPDVDWRREDWPGVSIGRDEPGVSDAFAGSGGVHLMDYTYDNWLTEDLIVKLPAEKLQEYISNDGRFGLALDPDSGYESDGISLSITTVQNPVPEPLTIFGLCAGVSSLAGYLRRRRRF